MKVDEQEQRDREKGRPKANLLCNSQSPRIGPSIITVAVEIKYDGEVYTKIV